MEEKTLVQGEGCKTNIFTTFLWVISGIYAVVGVVLTFISGPENLLALPIAVAVWGIGKIFAYLINRTELVVTNKRVYGKTAFGKRVDLPIDSVSAVSTGTLLRRVSVASSAGQIHFFGLCNQEEVYNCINQLLIQRQGGQQPKEVYVDHSSQSKADELKKYKELLDSGVITQEEFDATKKQLLGL